MPCFDNNGGTLSVEVRKKLTMTHRPCPILSDFVHLHKTKKSLLKKALGQNTNKPVRIMVVEHIFGLGTFLALIRQINK